MVENQWYSRLLNQSIEAKVMLSATSGMPTADHQRLERVQRASPSASCRKELRRMTYASQIQMAKKTATRRPKNPGFR